MITALALAALAAVVGLAYVAITRTDMARAADVRAADLAADLKVAEGNSESWRRKAQREAAARVAIGKVLNATNRDVAVPGAGTGVDVLLSALDFAASLGPVEPAARPNASGRHGAGVELFGGAARPVDPDGGTAGAGDDDPVSVPEP